MVVSASGEDVAAIGRVAVRIRRFAEAIQQAHEFGLGPGSWAEPWTVEFQRRAVEIYSDTLPWRFLATLAAGFKDCANLMVATPGPTSATIQWARMQGYLLATAEAISEKIPTAEQRHNISAFDLEPITTPVMPFDRLATIYSVDGAAALQQVGRTVGHWCGDTVEESPLTEQEMEWMRQIIKGVRSIDIATASGYSERSFYRALSDLWERLGVESRAGAIALVVDRGWVDSP